MSATAGPSRWSSDLGVAVLGGGRDLRDNIPVLDDLAVRVQAEDVDDLAAEWPVDRNGTGEERVRDDEIAVGEDPLDVDMHVGERIREAGDELNECVEAVRRERVVLDVLIAAVLLDGECRVLVVERHRVVADHVLLVALQQRPAALARLEALVAHRFSLPDSGADGSRRLTLVPALNSLHTRGDGRAKEPDSGTRLRAQAVLHTL